MLRRRNGTFQLLSSPMSLPATKMRPRFGLSSLFSRRIRVDLPEPEGPTKKTNSPFWMSQLASRRATTSPLKTFDTLSSLIMRAERPAGGGGDRDQTGGSSVSPARAASHVSIGCLKRAAPPSAKGDEMDPAPVTIVAQWPAHRRLVI